MFLPAGASPELQFSSAAEKLLQLQLVSDSLHIRTIEFTVAVGKTELPSLLDF